MLILSEKKRYHCERVTVCVCLYSWEFLSSVCSTRHLFHFLRHFFQLLFYRFRALIAVVVVALKNTYLIHNKMWIHHRTNFEFIFICGCYVYYMSHCGLCVYVVLYIIRYSNTLISRFSFMRNIFCRMHFPKKPKLTISIQSKI